MAITEKQAADRIKGIGSSDAAAVFGLSPYTTKHDLWLVKTGRADGFKGNKATKRGDFWESAIRDMVAEELGEKVVACPGPFVKGILRANLDGQVGKFGKGNPIVECKSSMIRDGWGDPGSNVVPPHVMIQVQHQMHCAESQICYVACLNWNMWPDIYPVEYDRDLGELIQQECERFWADHVTADNAPPLVRASDATLAAYNNIARRGGSVVEIDPELCAEFVSAKSRLDTAEEQVKLARAKIMQAIGDHEAFSAPGFKCSLSQVAGRKSLDSTRLKEEQPEIYEQYQKQGASYLTLRIKKESDK
jgi:putative phage-type endonuclease